MEGTYRRLVGALQNKSGDEFRYCWRESVSPDPSWELKIELMTCSGHRMGQFSLFRTQIKEPLMLDVDLFNWEFRIALSGALYRTMNRPSVSENPSVRLGQGSVSQAKIASALSGD
jgi:hypothetical protein